MKNLKTKLMSAVAMLTVSAVMLVGTSFAWYTLSTNPEVKGITATAVANENLEIALDDDYANGAAVDTASAVTGRTGTQGSTTGNEYTWGNLVAITSGDAQVGGVYTQLQGYELRPAAYKTGGGLVTASYGEDGRVNAIDQNLTDAAYVSGANGVAKVNLSDTQYAFKVVYWLRSNKAGNITLSDAKARDAVNGGDGAGSYIDLAGTSYTDKDTVHVAFKVSADGAGTATWVADSAITYGTISDNKVPLSGTVIADAAANTAYKVEMYVFLNGDKVTNATAATGNTIGVNVQFDNGSAVAMQK